nr:MAG TPA: hypothetical protein [Caudoviricetes sp.]
MRIIVHGHVVQRATKGVVTVMPIALCKDPAVNPLVQQRKDKKQIQRRLEEKVAAHKKGIYAASPDVTIHQNLDYQPVKVANVCDDGYAVQTQYHNIVFVGCKFDPALIRHVISRLNSKRRDKMY